MHSTCSISILIILLGAVQLITFKAIEVNVFDFRIIMQSIFPKRLLYKDITILDGFDQWSKVMQYQIILLYLEISCASKLLLSDVRPSCRCLMLSTSASISHAYCSARSRSLRSLLDSECAASTMACNWYKNTAWMARRSQQQTLFVRVSIT